MARWKYSFTTRSPYNLESTWEVGITEGHYQAIADGNDKARHARIFLIGEVLEAPTLIIAGWSRPGTEEFVVYAGEPNRDFQSMRIELPPRKRSLFLVFVFPEGAIDFWGWRDQDRRKPHLPEDLNGKIIWPPDLRA